MKKFLFFTVAACLFASTCVAQTKSEISVGMKVKVEWKNLSSGNNTFISTVEEISGIPAVLSINGKGYSERGFFRTDKSRPFVMVSKELKFIRLFPDANSMPWMSDQIAIKETKNKISFSGDLQNQNSSKTMSVKVTILKK